ncbi:MAG: thioredoxin [Oscillospiraceae bacterium]
MSEIIGRNEFEEKVLGAEKTVIADFFSETCGPCRRMAPILDEIAEEHGDELSVVKISIGSDPDLAIEYGVQYVPTMIFFRNGEELDRIVGAVSKNELLETVKKL